MDNLRIINSIGKKKNGCKSTYKKGYCTILEVEKTKSGKPKIFNGELGNGNAGCSILGVEKTRSGKLKYLVQWKFKNMPEQNYLIDSYIISKVYPDKVIEFYEKITTWN